MKYLILLLSIIFTTTVSAKNYDYKAKISATKYYKFEQAANRVSSNTFEFSAKGYNFKISFDELSDLVILSVYDSGQNKWKWINVKDTDQLERDCNNEALGGDCTYINSFLDDFYRTSSEILNRDYGDGAVIVPDNWKDGLHNAIANRTVFDESTLTISLSN